MIDKILEKMVEKEVARQIANLKPEEPQQVEDKLLTTAEACEYLRISKPTIHRWKQQGIIRHVRIGNNIRYKLSDLTKKTH